MYRSHLKSKGGQGEKMIDAAMVDYNKIHEKNQYFFVIFLLKYHNFETLLNIEPCYEKRDLRDVVCYHSKASGQPHMAFCLKLSLVPYIVCMNSDGNFETALLLSFRWSPYENPFHWLGSYVDDCMILI